MITPASGNHSKMENVNGSKNTEGKYPPGSFLDKISTLFVRAEKQEPQTQEKENVVLTAFQTLSNTKTCNGVDEGNDDPAGEGKLRNGADTGENGHPGTPDAQVGGDCAQGVVDSELVQVYRVETHSDAETENEEESDLVQSEQTNGHGVPCSTEKDGGRAKPISDLCGAEIESNGVTVDQNIKAQEVKDAHVLKFQIYMEKGSDKETEGSLGKGQREPVTCGSEGVADAFSPANACTPDAPLSDPTSPASPEDACTLRASRPSAMPTGPPCPSEHSPRTAAGSPTPALTKPPTKIQTALPGLELPPIAEDQVCALEQLPPATGDQVSVPVAADVANEGSTGSDCSTEGRISQNPSEVPDTPGAQPTTGTAPEETPDPPELAPSTQNTHQEECPSGAKEGQGCSSSNTGPTSIVPDPSTQAAGFSSRASFRGGALASSGPVERPLHPLRMRSLQRGSTEGKGTLLEQLTQIFSLDKKENPNDCGDPTESTEEPAAEGKESAPSENGNKPASAETAFEAFKSFFTPKSVKRRTEPPDLQVVREKMRNEQELLRAIFDRPPSKPTTPEHKALQKSEGTSSGDSEERTPGRLQAVWPPPRPEGEEEKVGLKYTEAEHQAALLQLKRECKEEVEKLNVKYEQQVFQIRGEHAMSITQLEGTIDEMRQELANNAAQSRGDYQEVAVSTEDDLLPKSFRNVCVQTDRETFIKSPEEERKPVQSHNAVWKKLNFPSISLGFMSKVEPASGSAVPPQPSLPLSSQSEQVPSSPPPWQGLMGPIPYHPPLPLAPSLPGADPPPRSPTPPPGSAPSPSPPPPGCAPPPPTPLSGCTSPLPTPLSGCTSPPPTPLSGCTSPLPTPLSGCSSPPPTPLSGCTSPPSTPLSGCTSPPSTPLSGCTSPPPTPLSGCATPSPPPLPGCGPPPPPPLPGCGPPPPPPLPGCGPPPPPPLPGCGPPPPPPLPGCGPPAPPPLAGGMSPYQSVGWAPRKRLVEPACPMRPLYWTRIQVQGNNCNTLWGSLEEPDIVNPQEFEDLFSKATPHPKKESLCEVYEKAKAKRIIKLLDGKRSQAVGILISSLHLDMKDIRKAIMTVDNSVVDLETIGALYENRAQNEELEKIKKHYETSKDDEVKLLDKPEQFLYELSQIPDFSDRVHCIIFQATFLEGISSIRQKVDIISDLCKCLQDRAGVKDVIGLILAFGNYMNGGNRTRGQADGFNLEILPKLKDVKSRDHQISLVDYVASYYLRNFDTDTETERAVFPLPEPQDLFFAAQVKFEDLSKDLRRLQRDLADCEKKIEKVCLSSSEEHLEPFKEKMESFVATGKKEHSEISSLLTSAQKSFQDMVEYFGVKPKSGEKEVAPSFIFMLWFEFCSDFKSAWKRESKRITKERLKAVRESVKLITEEKKVETRKINPNSLKKRLRQKEAAIFSSGEEINED